MQYQDFVAGDNYGSWSRAITIVLRVKNRLGFVDRSFPIPKGKKKGDIPYWERCNNK